MQSLKKQAIEAISKLPDETTIDDIMYRLYVIEKIRKGREAVAAGEVVSLGDLEKEIESW
jgi:hypothetical protein